ncbi:MAG: trimethylamine methyltransferase family protein [Pseudomonadota bacterium]
MAEAVGVEPGEPSGRRRRNGGRNNRITQRAQRLSADVSPIRAGLEGGAYRPLSDNDVQRIHGAALEALEVIGLANAPQTGVDAMVAQGAVHGKDGRVRFPAKVVERALASAARDVTLFGRDGEHDLQLTGRRVHFGTAGAAVQLVDPIERIYRDSVLADLWDAGRLVQNLDNVHFFQRPIIARDVTDNFELDVNTIYASCAGTTKHIGTSFCEPGFVRGCTDLLHMIAGSEEEWRRRPFVLNTNCFVVPPLKFATESCEVMEECIHAGMPVLLLSAGQAGATAPAPLAAAIVQSVAECLAGLVYVNAIKPGHTAVFGTWPFVSDLRTGAMSGGSGEQALLTAACAQMHRFYGLSGGAAAGIADSKVSDMQAGWEQMCSNVMAGLAGLNMVYEAVGMHASLLGFCHESLVLGNDMIGQVLRCVRGIEVTDETLCLDTMKAVCLDGPGHYLGAQQTLDLMQREFVYPAIADRMSPKGWEEKDRPDLIASARAKKENILETAVNLLDPALDADIRARFNIHLPSQ